TGPEHLVVVLSRAGPWPSNETGVLGKRDGYTDLRRRPEVEIYDLGDHPVGDQLWMAVRLVHRDDRLRAEVGFVHVGNDLVTDALADGVTEGLVVRPALFCSGVPDRREIGCLEARNLLQRALCRKPVHRRGV